jgi:hypothetical protein
MALQIALQDDERYDSPNRLFSGCGPEMQEERGWRKVDGSASKNRDLIAAIEEYWEADMVILDIDTEKQSLLLGYDPLTDGETSTCQSIEAATQTCKFTQKSRKIKIRGAIVVAAILLMIDFWWFGVL